MSSGLLPSVAIDAFVFLRSPDGGGEGSAFLLELLRDSHENGLVNLRVTGGAGADFSCAAGGGGGGGNLTGDILPDRPCIALVESRDSLGGSFGADVDFPPSSSSETSSMSDVTDILCAVRSGDFAAGPSPLEALADLGT